MDDKHKHIIYDDNGNLKPPIVSYLESFIKPVMEAEGKKNPRKIEDEIKLL